MDRLFYIEKGGKRITRRKYKDRWRLVFWVGLQLAWGMACVLYSLNVPTHPFWKVLVIQWPGIFALLYCQGYTARIRGVDIVFSEDAFEKGDVLACRQWDVKLLIFKKSHLTDGGIVCRCFPFYLSSKRWKTLTLLWWFKVLIGLKLIK